MDNPKPTAELSMLKQYGPDVPDATLQKLVAVFGELRSMADQGTITYPYSVREVVSIVKHLQVRTLKSNNWRSLASLIKAHCSFIF